MDAPETAPCRPGRSGVPALAGPPGPRAPAIDRAGHPATPATARPSWIRDPRPGPAGRGVGARGGAEPTGARGWRNFTSVPVENAEVGSTSDGEQPRPSRPTAAASSTRSSSRPGARAGTGSGSARRARTPAKAYVFVVDPQTRFGIVSDIDDTVMVTALPRPLLAAWHTFVVNEHARATTPGMPVLYERLTTPAPGRAGHLPVHRRLERRADPDPVPVPQPLPRRARCCSPTGGRPRTAGSAADASTSAARWSGWREEFPRHQVAADRRRRPARRVDLRRLR